MPASSAAAITSLSLSEPPGCATAATPAFAQEAGQPHAAPFVGLGRSPHQLAGDLGGGLDHLATSAEQVQAGDPWGGQLAGAQAGIGVEADQQRKRWGDGGGGELLDLGGGQEVHLAAGMTALPVTRWHALMVRWPLP